MGQRHQIYLRLPAVYYNENNPNNRPVRVVGIHHQWLYGQTALKLLVNFLTFTEKSQVDKTWRVLEILQAAYAIHPETGYFHGTCPELDEDEVKNPLIVDNNNGVTVIDLTGAKPRYCFMALHELECVIEKESVPILEPLDAKTYIGLHYKNFANEEEDKILNSRLIYKFVQIKNFQEYAQYYQKSEQEYEDDLKEAQEFRKLTRKLVAFLENYEVLTKKDIQEIFPAMFPKKRRSKAKNKQDNALAVASLGVQGR